MSCKFIITLTSSGCCSWTVDTPYCYFLECCCCIWVTQWLLENWATEILFSIHNLYTETNHFWLDLLQLNIWFSVQSLSHAKSSKTHQRAILHGNLSRFLFTIGTEYYKYSATANNVIIIISVKQNKPKICGKRRII